MKPLLSVDITEDKNNEIWNIEAYSVSTVSPETAQAVEREEEAEEQVMLTSGVSPRREAFSKVCGFIGLICVAMFFSFPAEEGLRATFAKSWWLLLIGAAGLITSLVHTILLGRLQARVSESEEMKQIERRINDLSNQILQELGAPDSADSIDLLAFRYRIKNGEIAVTNIGLPGIRYLKPSFKIFRSENLLCLVNLEERYEIPMDEIIGIRTVDEKVSFLGWEKDVPSDAEPYSRYQIKVNSTGIVTCKPYHILEIRSGEEILGIYFPCYELPTVEKLIGEAPEI